MKSLVKRWLRSRLLHFALVGTALFAVRTSLDADGRSPGPAAREPILISAERIRALETRFRDEWGTAPTPAQRRALVEQTVQEELLYREARILALELEDGSVRRRLLEKMRVLGGHRGASETDLLHEAVALGLDDDLVIRRLLAEKMRLVLQERAVDAPIAEDEIRAYVERHRAALTRPARLTLSHVFYSEDARGAVAEHDARAALAGLRSGALSPSQALASSDPFPLGNLLRATSEPQLQGRLGKPFAETVFAAAPDEWLGPIRSPFGLHLIRVRDRTAAALPSLDELRPTAVRALLRERSQLHLARGLTRLRALYEVRIDDVG